MAGDLTRREKAGMLSSESVLNILKLILAGAPLREVLTIIARIVEAQSDGMLCAIWFLDDEGKHFFCEAAPSLPPSYIEKVNGVAATPNGTSCGAAVFRREPVYVTDILTDPLWADYRDLAASYGLRSCWSWPLISSDGKVLGTFANYYRQPRSPNATDLSLIENAWNIVGIAIDRHLKENALRNTQAELANMARVLTVGELTASIAHEVNQPLSGIITNASTCLRMLDADPPNIEGARETARRTIRDGNRAAEVITRLRALFSHRQATTEAVDLNEATREVIALLLSKLQRGRVVLQSKLADDLPLVTGDRVQLQQVIMNLLQNASDAMSDVHDRSRQLVIETQRDETDHVRLVVQDSGIGLDPQIADRLFDAFYTTKDGGMGIGLSISRSIIENHQGRIWAKPNDGPGATFSFSIPRNPGGAIGDRRLNSKRKPIAAREAIRDH